MDEGETEGDVKAVRGHLAARYERLRVLLGEGAVQQLDGRGSGREVQPHARAVAGFHQKAIVGAREEMVLLVRKQTMVR